MALNKEAPGFDIDDEVLLMDSSIDSDLMSEEDDSAPTARTKSKKHPRRNSTSTLTTPGRSTRRSCTSMKLASPRYSLLPKKFILRGCRKVATRPGANA